MQLRTLRGDMRDYLYMWSDPEDFSFVASGVKFKDLLALMKPEEGVLLLSHEYDDAKEYGDSGFGYVRNADMRRFMKEDLYSWGDLVWADVNRRGKIKDAEIADLLYFRHRARPYLHRNIESIGNQFLVHQHDDGWFLKMLYSYNSDIRMVVEDLAERARTLVNDIDVTRVTDAVLDGKKAVWITESLVDFEEITMDVDSMLRKRYDKKLRRYV